MLDHRQCALDCSLPLLLFFEYKSSCHDATTGWGNWRSYKLYICTHVSLSSTVCTTSVHGACTVCACTVRVSDTPYRLLCLLRGHVVDAQLLCQFVRKAQKHGALSRDLRRKSCTSEHLHKAAAALSCGLQASQRHRDWSFTTSYVVACGEATTYLKCDANECLEYCSS